MQKVIYKNQRTKDECINVILSTSLVIRKRGCGLYHSFVLTIIIIMMSLLMYRGNDKHGYTCNVIPCCHSQVHLFRGTHTTYIQPYLHTHRQTDTQTHTHTHTLTPTNTTHSTSCSRWLHYSVKPYSRITHNCKESFAIIYTNVLGIFQWLNMYNTHTHTHTLSLSLTHSLSLSLSRTHTHSHVQYDKGIVPCVSIKF